MSQVWVSSPPHSITRTDRSFATAEDLDADRPSAVDTIPFANRHDDPVVAAILMMGRAAVPCMALDMYEWPVDATGAEIISVTFTLTGYTPGELRKLRESYERLAAS